MNQRSSADRTNRRQVLRHAAGASLAGAGSLLLLGCRRDTPARQASATRVARIGFLSAGRQDSSDYVVQPVRQALRELGWIEGQTVLTEYRFSEFQPDRLPGLAAELVELDVDLIITVLPRAAHAAKQATGTIPIVMVQGAADPVAEGLVPNLARPGGNLTGFGTGGAEAYGTEQLELLKEAAPAVSHVGVYWNIATFGPVAAPLLPVTVTYIQILEAGARDLGLRLRFIEVNGFSEFESALQAAVDAGIDGLHTLAVNLDVAGRAAQMALTHRLPSVATQWAYARAGGLIAAAPDVTSAFRPAAGYVDRILRGTPPGDLPVQQPTKFDTYINVCTAQTLGLTIPPAMLARATEVFRCP